MSPSRTFQIRSCNLNLVCFAKGFSLDIKSWVPTLETLIFRIVLRFQAPLVKPMGCRSRRSPASFPCSMSNPYSCCFVPLFPCSCVAAEPALPPRARCNFDCDFEVSRRACLPRTGAITLTSVNPFSVVPIFLLAMLAEIGLSLPKSNEHCSECRFLLRLLCTVAVVYSARPSLSFPPAAITSTLIVFLPVSSFCSFVVPPGRLFPVRPVVISNMISTCFFSRSLLLGAASAYPPRPGVTLVQCIPLWLSSRGWLWEFCRPSRLSARSSTSRWQTSSRLSPKAPASALRPAQECEQGPAAKHRGLI